MAAPLLQLSGIALTFGGTPLLEGVDFLVSAGERVCLVGRNGSGKSTLLKIAAQLIEPDGGTAFLKPDATIRYLPQEPDLSGFATTAEYVEAGLGPNDDQHVARYLMEQLGLRGDENPAVLSGGEARRAAAFHAIDRAVSRVRKIDLARFILAEGGDAEPGGKHQPVGPLGALPLDSPDAAATVVAIEIDAAQSGIGAPAIHESARNRTVIVRMGILGYRQNQALHPAVRRVTVQAFHTVPAIVFAAVAGCGLVIHLFIGILTNVGDP